MKTAMKLGPLLIAAGCAVAAFGSATAADPVRQEEQSQVRERIYGSDLMTAQERTEYSNRMRLLRSEEEREQLRKEHHEQMQERAKARGLTLRDDPPSQGRGAGPRIGNPPAAGAGPRNYPPAGAGRGR